MKSLLLVLLGLTSSITISPCFARTTSNMEVHVNADVVDPNYMTLLVTNDLRIPTVYNEEVGQVTSESQTKVLGGIDGSNAVINVTGRPGITYSLYFSEKWVLTDTNKNNLFINLSMGTGSGNKEHRLLDGSGIDSVSIMGSVNLDGLQPIGSYSNPTNLFAVTASVDE